MVYDFDTLYPRRRIGASKWHHLTEALSQGNKDVFPFSVADMDFKVAPEIQEALHEAADFAIYGYYHPQPAYYEAVRAWQQRRYGFSCRPEWIVQVPNIVYALYQLVRTFTAPGDAVIVQPPVYPPLFQAAEQQQRHLLVNPLIEGKQQYTMDLADLEVKAADPRARMLILCNPHNPVGRVWLESELLDVWRICRKRDILLVSDEIHADLVFQPHHHTVLAALDQKITDRCIICTAPSKTFNLAGLTNANLMIPNENLRRRYQAAMRKTGIHGTNYFGTVACQAAYEKGESWYQALLAYLAGNRALFAETMQQRIPQLRTFPIEGTYLGWIDMRALTLSGQERLALLQAADLHFTAGEVFGREGAGFERINLALPRQALQSGLDRLAEVVLDTGGLYQQEKKNRPGHA
ncbi:MAG: pyridoxal phosphate-dependent aminotransferase [Ruminococcaceae bacterium]|nr:pyridoxal phosphate-dependent aminotransferase [Oscillospiraceae bacterium]